MNINQNFKRFVIVNTHTVLNPGDSAIVLAQVDTIRRCYPKARVSITSRMPRIDKKYYEPMGINVYGTLIPALGSFSGLSGKAGEFFRSFCNMRDKVKLIKEIKSADLILSCGGGYLYSYNTHFPELGFLQNVAHIALAIFFGKTIILMPQSFGPFQNSISRLVVKLILTSRFVKRVFVREQISMDILRSLCAGGISSKLTICADMAFLFNIEGNNVTNAILTQIENAKKIGPVAVFTLRYWDFPEEGDILEKTSRKNAYMDSLLEAVRAVVDKYKGTVVLVPHVVGPEKAEDDRLVTEEFYKRVIEYLHVEGRIILIKSLDILIPKDIVEIYSLADVVVATRFHSAIFALLSSVPVIAIGYQHKCMGILKMLSLEKYFLDINSINPSSLFPLLDTIILKDDRLREDIKAKLKCTRENMFRKMKNILSEELENRGCEELCVS